MKPSHAFKQRPSLNSPDTHMKTLKTSLILFAAAFSVLSAHAAPLSLEAGTYTQNFNSFAASGRNPFPSWEGRSAASATSLGNAITNINGAALDWSNTGGALRNVSSANIPFSSTSAEQAANPDRAFGIRQVNVFGDPGASINFNFSTLNLNVQSLSLEALLLDIAPTTRSTTITIQYGIGTAPTSFTTLATWSEPGELGTTPFTFDRSVFGSALDGQSSVWFRFVALTASSGTGTTRDLIAMDNFVITTTAVPEPSTYALIGLGALALATRFRRTRA
jgi:hypothetical protein